MEIKKKSILIIEDDPDILECCKESLKTLDFFDFIVTASNATEAINKMNNQKFTFCLTDMNLGNKTVLDIFNVLLKQFEPNQITILSGYLDEQAVKKFIQYKITNIMTKPIQVSKLIEHFESQIKKVK